LEYEQITQKIRYFLDDNGRLAVYPAKFKKRILVLVYLASKFKAQHNYTENDVNELLQQWHVFNDWAMLRRELCDYHFLRRSDDGTSYWLEEQQPTLESFNLS